LCRRVIISVYDAGATFPVYCHACWWSDKWDPRSYGAEYDFSQPFFAQFHKLMNRVPRVALLIAGSSVNSDYVRIPTKTDNESDARPTDVSRQSRQQSERSDAGALIISEVDGFGQSGTAFWLKLDSCLDLSFLQKEGSASSP
jgi:hypothetical protein